MALTPEDVINKRFQPTKFREGYDQDEVDDFLDEIVVELRRLNQENAELRDRLEGADAPTAASEAETSSAVSAQDSAQEQETVEPVSAPVAEQPAVAGAYTVVSGDTLGSIASQFGLDWQQLFNANTDTVEDPNLIYVGDQLQLPVVN